MRFFPKRSALVLCMVMLTTGVVAAQVPVENQTPEMYPLAAPDTPLADEPGPTGTAPELSAFSVMKLSGRLVGADGAPLTGTAGVTFSFYSDQAGGTPLWIETQTVTLDEDGRYTVLMGSQSATGLPMEMFSTGEARWLSVETLSGPEQQRILLVSVPYAMKAAEADRLGGRAADEFVLNETLETAVRNELRTQIELDAGLTTDSSGTVKSLTGSGTAGQIARWGTATSLGPSEITADGTGKIGIGTTTPTARLEVAGMVKATTYVGNGTNLGGIPTLARSNTFVAPQNFFKVSSGPVVAPILVAQGTFDDDGSHSNGLLTVRNSGTGAGLLVRSQNRAIQGISLATTGAPFGLSGTTAADGGIGIYGLASAPVGTAKGLYGLSWANGGYGILGKALSTTGANVGVGGVSMSTDGTAMVAKARHATGNTTGLRIEVRSPNGALISALGAGTELFGVDGAGNVRANAFFDLLGNPVGGAAVGDITAVLTPPGGGIEAEALTGDATLRLLTTCVAGDVLQSGGGVDNWACAAVGGGGTITGIITGGTSGLSGGALTGDATLTLDSTCIAGQILTSSGSGVWGCAADADSGGTITGIITGGTSGLSGGALTGDATLTLDSTCIAGQILTSSGSGVWACAADADSGGTVTSITAGAGLTATPNPIIGIGTLSLLTSCAADEVLAWDGVSSWACAGVPQLGVTNTFTAGQIITTTDVSALDATSSHTAARAVMGTASDTTASAVGVYGKTSSLFGAGGTFENTGGPTIISAIDLFGATVFEVRVGGEVTTAGLFSGSGAGLTNIPVASLLGEVAILNGGTAATNPAQARVNLGAAAATHNHDGVYVRLIGDTMTGALVSSVASTADAVTASSGYINLALTTGSPVATDCDAPAEYGRMKVDAGSGTETLWVCTSTGWKSTALI